MHGQVRAICPVLIFFKDEKYVGIQYCSHGRLMDLCGMGSVEDEIFNMMFK